MGLGGAGWVKNFSVGICDGDLSTACSSCYCFFLILIVFLSFLLFVFVVFVVVLFHNVSQP